MTAIDLKKETDIFNNSFKKSKLYELLTEAAKNGNCRLNIATFQPPPLDRSGNKKQVITEKEIRKQLQTFFKENRKSISLTNSIFCLSLPEQLVKVLQMAAIPPGINWKPNTGGELYSFVEIDNQKETDTSAPGLTNTFRLLNLFTHSDISRWYGAQVSFSNFQLRQVTPLPLSLLTPQSGTVPQQAGEDILSPTQLKDLQKTSKYYQSLDKKSRSEIDGGLNYLARFQGETDPQIKLPLLFAALEFFIRTPAASSDNRSDDSLLYFTAVCLELAEKIDLPSHKKAFSQTLFNLRTKQRHDPTTIKTPLSDSQENTVYQMETLYRELLRKMLQDGNFLKQTLPKIRTNQRKELKKNKLKAGWRKILGNRINRLFSQH